MEKNKWFCVVLWDNWADNTIVADRNFDTIEQALSYIENVKKHSIGLKIELREYAENEGYVTRMTI